MSFSLALIKEVPKNPSQIKLSAPLAMFNLKTTENFVEESIVSYSQKQLTFMIDSINKETLISGANSTREKARINSIGRPKAGAWLNATPSKALGLHMSNKDFQVALKYRLGVPVFNLAGICPACN